MEKFNESDLKMAVAELSLCEFFPQAEMAQAAVRLLLARICPHREALIWLVRQFTDRIGKWHGPAELRAVLATRWLPADGINAYSTIAGFRPEDSEAKVFEEHEQRKVGWLPEAGERVLISSDPEMDRIVRRLLEKSGLE